MFFDPDFMASCGSNGGMAGMPRSAENSMVPSTLKWIVSSGGRNSRKVDLKKASYSSFVTSRGFRVQSGLLSFWTTYSVFVSHVVFMRAGTGSAVSPSPAAASAASWAALVASSSMTSTGTSLSAHNLMGKLMNSEYCLINDDSLLDDANDPASSSPLRWSVIRVPRLRSPDSSSAMVYWCEPAEDSHTYVFGSLLLFVSTTTLSATRKAL
mmetsp:Transcript_985/g.2960  ORF Transcript_985/g.2960 Transcript_985/m.2960 type:complete len:211 (+) Transcript_985:3382-4014(+)